MKKSLLTIIVFIITLLIIIGMTIIGVSVYLDLTNGELQEIYIFKGVATEEPDDNSKTKKTSQNISSENITSKIETDINNTKEEVNSEIGEKINLYFYEQLNNRQKIIYEKLLDAKSNLKQGDYVINYGNTFSDILSEDDGKNILGDDYQTAIEAFTHDNPDLFYLDVNKMYLNIETTKKFFKTTYNVYISPASGQNYLSDDFQNPETIELAIKKIEQVKNRVLNELAGNDYQKITYIHNYIVNNVEYDTSYNEPGTYTIYGALIEGKCVCEGYTKAFKYLTNAAGLKSEMMQGYATNSSGQTEAHAWNCIKLDGLWYVIDVTWDDPIIIGNGIVSDSIKYRYFLKGSSTFDKDHKLSYQFSENGKSFAYPLISTKDY